MLRHAVCAQQSRWLVQRPSYHLTGRPGRSPPIWQSSLKFRAPVHLKLKGCGTHIEHILSVHDLFRRVACGRPEWGEEEMLNRKKFQMLGLIPERLKGNRGPASFH